MAFVDFKKAYELVVRRTISAILRRFGIDDKFLYLIQQTSLKIFSQEMKLTSEMFGIKTELRLGDGLSLLLFNVCWTAEDHQRIKEVGRNGQQNGVKVSPQNTDISIDYFDVMLFCRQPPNNSETDLNTATKTGLRISFEKT